jgi:hypothetical protein|tara:strand:- start:1451 stop:1669 length:219 start_codon:yes stop_codon:yes gene_type:complete
MNNLLFAININAVLENGTEVSNVKGFVIDNKVVYKTSENEILTGDKKIKEIFSSTITVPIGILSYISNIEKF